MTLIAILVVAVAVLAVVALSNPAPQKIPAVNLVISNESSTVSVYHGGGDPIPVSDFYLAVNCIRVAFAGAGSDNIWSVGETLTAVSSGPPDNVDVIYSGTGSGQYLLITRQLGNGTRICVPATVTPTPTVTPAIHVITATAGTGGSISPDGRIMVNDGESREFTITPAPGYQVAGVVVDGMSVGAVTKYRFENVMQDHTIEASFLQSGSLFLLTASKSASLNTGGHLQFRVTSPASFITHGAMVYALDQNDVVKLVIGTDTTGNILATTTTISSFDFDGVRLYINGEDKGTRNMGLILISGYDQLSSTLTIDVPSATEMTVFAVDGNLLISDYDASRIQIYNIRPSLGIMNFNNEYPGEVYYYGGGTGYLISPESGSPVTADFTGSPVTGARPLLVRFTDASTGPVQSWYWSFGDGGSSTLQNPWHVYDAAGSYTVSLKVSSYGVSSTETKNRYVIVGNPPPSVWSVLPTHASAGETLTLNVFGLNFQDGATVNLTHASHTAIPCGGTTRFSSTGLECHLAVPVTAAPDSYDLQVTNPDGQSTTKAGIFRVYPSLFADFSWVEQGNSGEVIFTDLSKGNPTYWYWTFGDGSVSTLQNPYTHAYNKKYSPFTVTLNIYRSSDGAWDSVTRIVSV